MHNSIGLGPIRSAISRALFLGVLAIGLGACTTTGTTPVDGQQNAKTAIKPQNFIEGNKSLDERYGPDRDEPFKIKPIPNGVIPEKFERTVVAYPSREAPGTIIVEPSNHYLYFVAGNGKAIRYGVSVGAAGLGFQGEADLKVKRKWPRWIPTKDMIARAPERYKKYENGVDGGPSNPLGARALYLYQNNVDTYYRIHGTNQPSSIGKSVSAGCIRMANPDVIDLFARVRTGAKVIVR